MFVPFGKFSAWRMPSPSEHGATAVEYGLMLALIAAVIVVTVAALGQTVFGLFSSVPNF